MKTDDTSAISNVKRLNQRYWQKQYQTGRYLYTGHCLDTDGDTILDEETKLQFHRARLVGAATGCRRHR